MTNFNNAFDSTLSPKKYIQTMFENTDKNGVLYIPGWYYLNEPEYSLRCKIKWNERDLENIIFEFDGLVRQIEKIANIYRKASEYDLRHIKDLICEKDLYAVWFTYFQPFVYEKVKQNKIEDIADKIETIKTIKNLEHKMWSDEQVESYERSLYEEYKDLKVSKEETEIYTDYCRAFYDDCEQRVGSNVGASDLILRARRLCKLIESEVPESLINHEACMLAAALVIHTYASSMEKVDDSLKASEAKFNMITSLDEEDYEDYLDELYRPRKRNNRKQMLSLFVYKILVEKSSPDKRLSQQNIIDELQEMPYELTVERKAISRIIHGLAEELIGIHYDPKGGSWYDASDDEYGIKYSE